MSISNRASLGVANRGIKDSKTNRRTGNANNIQQQLQPVAQEPFLMEPANSKTSGSGRFPSLKKIPTASRTSAGNGGAPKQGKLRVPPALSSYQPKNPAIGISRPQTPSSHLSNSTPIPSAPGRARPVPRQPPVQLEPQYEDEDEYGGAGEQYDDERTEDFTFGTQVSAKPLPAPRRIDAAVRMQQNTPSLRRPPTVDRSTTRPIARPIPSQPSANPIVSQDEENVLIYKVSSSIEPRKKTVLDALCKYIGELDEVTVLTIAKLVNDFLKRNSQQQSRSTVVGSKSQLDDSGEIHQHDDMYDDSNIDERPIDDQHEDEENVFEDE